MAIQLDAMLSLAEPFTADTDQFLRELQGNVVRGHGRHFTANVFVNFPSAAVGREFVAAMVDRVTSARDQFDQAAAFRANGTDGGLFTIVLLTAAGYRALGAVAAQPDDRSFLLGMEVSGQSLADPPRSTWDPTFATAPHALVLLADNNESVVEQAVNELTATAGVVVLGVERGRHLQNSMGRPIEHFGYVDGRSQPIPVAEDAAAEPRTRFDPSTTLDQFLVPCPGGDTPNSFGSYMVFRKLEQNVAGFKAAEVQLASDIGTTREVAGAMVVGRFEDGTPLATSTAPIGAATNDFGYDSGPDALPPRQAHIRKTNPRDDLGPGSIGPQMLRRGIPFGTRPDHPNDPTVLPGQRPTGGVGLLFMAYQANIGAQFEFMQSTWANNPHFTQLNTGRDPVIGQGAVVNQQWKAPGQPAAVSASFANFVTLKGGDYFFAPCLSALRGLGAGSAGSGGVFDLTISAVDALPTNLLRRGDSGEDVAIVQRFIAAQRAIRTALGFRARQRPVDPGVVDGSFGAVTRDAVKSWQRIIGVGVDGVWGPETAGASVAVARVVPPLPDFDVFLGDVGDHVIAIQTLLTARAALAGRLFPSSLETGVDPGGIDGRFGNRTADAVATWRTFLGLDVDRFWDFTAATESEPFTSIAS